MLFLSFFFNDTATTEIYTLSLHDALPILLNQLSHCCPKSSQPFCWVGSAFLLGPTRDFPCSFCETVEDRKSTRLNSSHANISYAVFCLKKKKNHTSKLKSSHYLVGSLLLV